MIIHIIIVFEHRPLISIEDCKTLQEVFDECLPVKEQNKIEKPHWKILKEMSKEQRKQFQQSNNAVKYRI